MADGNVDFIYLTIPADYVIVYKKLMECLLECGIDVLKQCDCNCKNNKTRILFDCWCAFQSAIAAKKLGQEKVAEVIINYINAQIDIVCNNEEVCDCTILPIDVTKGIIEVISNCEKCNIPKFYVDINTGNLYSEYDGDVEAAKFNIINGNLVKENG